MIVGKLIGGVTAIGGDDAGARKMTPPVKTEAEAQS